VDIIAIQQKATALAKAIAKAEGFGVPGALPTRINNPGDMELGDRGWGTEAAKTIYPKADWNADFSDKTDGCSALRRECFAILTGASHSFDLSWSFAQLAQEWTGGDKPAAWASIVSQSIGISTETTVREYTSS
jgi:hypothetical protein